MTITPLRVLVAIVVLATAGVGIYAVSQPPMVDTDRNRKQISDGLFDQTGIVTDEVTCPGKVPVKKGATHLCTARAEGGNITVKVTQTNEKGGTRWRTIKGLVVSAKIEDLIENHARDVSSKDMTLDCGRRHRVAVVDRSFECLAESRSGHEMKMRVTMNDERGNVSWAPEL